MQLKHADDRVCYHELPAWTKTDCNFALISMSSDRRYNEIKMNNLSVFPITHSILDANAIGGLIRSSYDLPEPLSCELMVRSVNEIYLLVAGKSKYVVRVLRHGSRNPAQLAYEVDLIRFFEEAGIAVTAPIAAMDGGYSQEIIAPEGNRYITIFEWAPGVPLWDRPETNLIEKLGEIVARMHEIAPRFSAPFPVKVDTASYILGASALFLASLQNDPDEAAFYENLIYGACSAFRALEPSQFDSGGVHSDIHMHNVFVSEDNQLTFLDWDNCGHDFLAKELAAFTWRNVYLDAPIEYNDAYLRGYGRARELTDIERANMPLFMTLRHLYVLCGMATLIPAVGRNVVGYHHSLARFRKPVEAAAEQAGLL